MATETIVSPGVLLKETDKSFITPGVDPSGLAIIGPAAKGPIEIPTPVTNYNDFKEIFGTTIKSGSQAYEYFTNLAVKNYFDNGGASALILRVVSASNSWAASSNTHLSASSKDSTQPFTLQTLAKGVDLNNTHAGSAGIDKLNFNFTTINTSSLELSNGNGNRNIAIVSGGVTYQLVFSGSQYDAAEEPSGTVIKVDLKSMGALGAPVLDTITPVTASILVSESLGTGGFVTNASNAIVNAITNTTNGVVAFAGAGLGDLDITVGAGIPSTITTSEIKEGALAGGTFSNGGLPEGSKDNIRWEIGNINSKAGTFTLTIRRGDDTTNSPLVLEQFTNCSLDPLSPNYISRKIGDQSFTVAQEGSDYVVNVSGEFENRSNFVRVSSVNLPTYQYLAPNGSVASDTGGSSYENSLPIAQSGSFQNGTGQNPPTKAVGLYGSASSVSDAHGAIQGLKTSDYTKAISILKNKEEFKFKTLVIPGLNQEQHSSTLDTIISNTTLRGDSLFVTDLVPYGSARATVKSEAEELNTNYAAAYWPWVQIRSTELNRNIWNPASAIIPGVFAKNDSLSAPWFAPAGETRGRLGRLAIKVEKKLSKTQRDDLYTSKVNPIATFSDIGLTVFGQKTLQQASSALDRINVRRLLLDVKDTIGDFANKLVFEQNTQQTRDRFIRQATPYLESLVQRQGIYAFQIKMDGQLNTSDVIDENKLVGQVFLQPTKTAEFIVLDFVLTPTGASFTD
jgi:hypothetical protein